MERHALAMLAVAILAPVTLNAQYFGQNKIRYRDLDWQVLKTEHFDIYYYQRERSTIDEFGRMAERWNERLSKLLGWQLSSRQPVIVYANHTDFRSTTALPGAIGETTGGVTEGIRRRVILPFAGPMAETDHVLGHELVHAFQYDIGARRGAMVGGASRGSGGLESLPLWFIEGMAEYLSLGPQDPNTSMWVRDAVRREAVPDFRQLDEARYFPYRFGQAFWAYVAGRHGDQIVGQIFRAAARSGSPESAINSVLHITAEALAKEWRQTLVDEYEPVLKLTHPPEQQANAVIMNEREGDPLSTSPIVSPDGKYMVYFSSRGLFSIDLYLADAKSGDILDKITNTAVDPHFDSLEFVNSSGAWSKDSTRFAFPAIGKGLPEFDIYELQKREVVRRVDLHDFGEVTEPSWSPDGLRIVFSGMKGGVMNLYVVDLRTNEVQALTQGLYADMQPAWSPDGRTIAFVTDRFTSNLDVLDFRGYRLAILDLDSREIREIQAFDRGKHINPDWGADGSLYFISDHTGISNIYRRYTDGRITQITNVQTGVSGISSLSPAFSVASNDSRVLFSVFLNGNYSIFSTDGGGTPSGAQPSQAVGQLTPGVLPPRERATGAVASLLDQPAVGLRPSTEFKHTDYHPSLGLEYIAPPSVVVGAGSFGSMVGGGTALYFTDLLGQHTLVASLQTSNTSESGKFFNSIAATVGYLNQTSRWNWGFFGGQQPFLTAQFGEGLANVGGQTVLIEQATRYWQINREASGILSYPFSRAQRLEFSGGFRNISFDAQTQTRVFDPVTGEFLGQTDSQSLASPDALNSGVGSAALVWDTAVFGGTSPVLGQSYRFEVGGSGGSLNFGTLLLDYRRYIRIVRPLSFAARALHYGRYFGDYRDRRLQDLFLGYPTLLRGYDPNSFSAAECGSQLQATGSCPVFDQLFGSRMAVGNAELRLEVLGPLGIVPSRRIPPVEIAPFYDAGITWSRANIARLADLARKPITSYGASLRVNLLGFAVGQISLVHPNDRPLKNWRWEFSLTPGF